LLFTFNSEVCKALFEIRGLIERDFKLISSILIGKRKGLLIRVITTDTAITGKRNLFTRFGY